MLQSVDPRAECIMLNCYKAGCDTKGEHFVIYSVKINSVCQYNENYNDINPCEYVNKDVTRSDASFSTASDLTSSL